MAQRFSIRRLLRFSLRSLLLGMLLVNVLLGVWFGWQAQAMYERRRVLAEIRELEGKYGFVDPLPQSEPWSLNVWIQTNVLRDENLDVRWISLEGTKVTDDFLPRLKCFPRLTGLHLGDTPITDQGARHLAGISQLRYLDLAGTKITDASLAEIASRHDLHDLGLEGTEITPAGVVPLASLPELEFLMGADGTMTDGNAFEQRRQELGYNQPLVTGMRRGCFVDATRYYHPDLMGRSHGPVADFSDAYDAETETYDLPKLRACVSECLQHRDFSIRVAAVLRAYTLPPEEAQAIWLKALADPDDDVKCAALRRLADYNGAELTEAECLSIADFISSSHRASAAEAIETLRNRVSQPPPALRSKIKALAQPGTLEKPLRTELRELLNDWDTPPVAKSNAVQPPDPLADLFSKPDRNAR